MSVTHHQQQPRHRHRKICCAPVAERPRWRSSCFRCKTTDAQWRHTRQKQLLRSSSFILHTQLIFID